MMKFFQFNDSIFVREVALLQPMISLLGTFLYYCQMHKCNVRNYIDRIFVYEIALMRIENIIALNIFLLFSSALMQHDEMISIL